MIDVQVGAYSAFEGWVRNHHLGKGVVSLEYEAYEALAVKEGDRILREAVKRYGIQQARCVHRIGHLYPGDLAVWVGVTAVHRSAAFDACRYIIDQVKARVPIWKHEFYEDGSHEWVDPTDCRCGSDNGVGS